MPCRVLYFASWIYVPGCIAGAFLPLIADIDIKKMVFQRQAKLWTVAGGKVALHRYFNS